MDNLGLIAEMKIQPISVNDKLYQVLVKKTSNSEWVKITDVGFGVSQILPVLVLCHVVKEGSTIILEQPEIHLHPSVQAGLADIFIDVIKNRNIQIMLESHSEHLLRRLQRRIAEERLAKDDVALYFCEYKEDHSELKELDVDEYGNIKNWPKDFFADDMGELAAMTIAEMDRKLKAEGP